MSNNNASEGVAGGVDLKFIIQVSRNGFPVGHNLVISDPFARDLGLSQVFFSLISVSLSREHGYLIPFSSYLGVFIFQLRAEERDSTSVYIVGLANQFSSVVTDTMVHVQSIGYNLQVQIIFSNIELNQPTTFKETSVRPLMDTAKIDPLHVLPISVQQILGFISSGDPAQAGCGYMFRSWVLNH